jgi:thymidine kinase
MARYAIPAIRPHPGDTITIVGNMGTGKSTVMFQLAQEPKRQREGVLFFFPADANRISGTTPTSRILATYPGTILFNHPDEIAAVLQHSTALHIFIDEIHSPEQDPEKEAALRELVVAIRLSGRNLYMAGLKKDFRGEHFQLVMDLAFDGDRIIDLETDCAVCGHRPADLPQRLEFGHPVPRTHPRWFFDTDVANQSGVTYEPRCRMCHSCPSEWTETSLAIHRSQQAHFERGQNKPNHE